MKKLKHKISGQIAEWELGMYAVRHSRGVNYIPKHILESTEGWEEYKTENK